MPTRQQSATITPPLKWAGGKRWLVPTLLPIWQRSLTQNPNLRLLEPFCGGLSVALGLQPQRALLNDINPHLINVYQQIQFDGLPITEDFQNEKATYYRVREQLNEVIQQGTALTVHAKRSAQQFYYLNRTGFNGLCRFNQKGLYNVPFGRYNTIAYAQNFVLLQQQIQGWQFTSGSFEHLGQLNDTDFIYADPPYDTPFTDYAPGGFTWEQQVQLAQWLATHTGQVVISNQATDRILELYNDLGFEIQILDAPRRIAANGNRTPAQEMLATRNV